MCGIFSIPQLALVLSFFASLDSSSEVVGSENSSKMRNEEEKVVGFRAEHHKLRLCLERRSKWYFHLSSQNTSVELEILKS